jgi:hypothetical protein
MARPLKIAWKHPAEGFYQLYKQEVEARIAKRWQALGMLRRGERLKRVKEVGVQPQADSAGTQGVEGGRGRGMGPCGFSQGEGGGRGGRPTLLSPAEQVFAEVRRWVEGRRYERIEAKKAAGEGVLRGLEAEKRVSSLVGRPYIRQALNGLPS